MFLDRGAEAKALDAKGNTLLMQAATSDAVPVASVKALIERGVDLTRKTPKGELRSTLPT